MRRHTILIPSALREDPVRKAKDRPFEIKQTIPGKGFVPIDDAYALPREFSIETRIELGDAKARLDVQVDDRGTPRCVRIEIVDDGITAETIRSVAVARLLRLGTTAVLMKHERLEGGQVQVVPATTEEQRRFYHRYANTRRPRRGSPISDDTLQKVATVYRAAAGRGDPPSLTVAETMGVSRSTAARWVARAREQGFLGQALRGRAGEAR
jgi:hypothetical protein